MPQLVDLDGREATPIPPERYWRSAARSQPAGVAGINRNRWPGCSGLGGRIRPDWVAGIDRNAQSLNLALCYQ